MKAPWLAAAACTLLAASPVSARQGPDARGAFVQALADFSLALEGRYGDEGEQIASSLDSMERALGAWDATIQGYEAAMAAERAAAAPALAARMHMALGGVYLDRGRVQDALRELVAASALDPGRADVHMLIGLARRQLAAGRAGAIDAFRRASDLDPTDPIRAYVLGRHLAAAGHQDEAFAAFARFRESARRRMTQGQALPAFPFIHIGLVPESAGVEPYFPPVRYASGFQRLIEGQYPEALAAFRLAAGSDPLTQGPAGTMRAAGDAFRNGSIESAAGYIRAAIAAEPDRAEPHRVLGLVLAANGQYDDAIEELRTAVRLAPRDERARVGLASVLIEANEAVSAQAVLAETLTVLPASGLAQYMSARLHERLGDDEAALRELGAALESNPLIGANGIYQTMGAMEATRQDFEAAARAYSTRIELHPNDPDAHYDLGDIYLRLGRHEEALAELTVAVMLNPDIAKAHAAMAQVHLRDGRYAEAIEWARRAIALDLDHEQARYTLATALIRSGNTGEGRKELAVFERLQAASAAARSRIFEVEGLKREAALATAAGDHEKAVALRHRVFVLAPEAASSHLELGLAHLKAGQHVEAIDRLRTAAVLDPGPDAHRHLADAYAAAGQPEESEREMAAYRRLRLEALRRRSAAR